MRKCFIIPALIIALFVATGQKPEAIYKNQIKLSAFRAINILNPGVEISYERLHSPKLSSQVLFGIAANIIGKPFKELRGFNFGFEEKHFFSRKSKTGRYISLSLNHSDRKYQEKTWGIDPTTNLMIVDTFTIAGKTTSMAFRYGIQFYKNRFLWEVNLGAGLKYRTIKHSGRMFDYEGPREPFELHRAANVEKKGFAFHLPITIQIGYRF